MGETLVLCTSYHKVNLSNFLPMTRPFLPSSFRATIRATFDVQIGLDAFRGLNRGFAMKVKAKIFAVGLVHAMRAIQDMNHILPLFIRRFGQIVTIHIGLPSFPALIGAMGGRVST